MWLIHMVYSDLKIYIRVYEIDTEKAGYRRGLRIKELIFNTLHNYFVLTVSLTSIK